MLKNKKLVQSFRKLTFKTKALYLFLIVLFIYLVNIAVAPLQKMQEFKELVNSDSVFLAKYDSVYYHPEMEALLKERAYKNAVLKQSEYDSIHLVIDLADSSVNLCIKGVVLHQAKINKYKRDKIFRKMPLIQEVKLFGQPLKVEAEYASIVKEPIVVHYAPKDEQEAALNAYQPDTLIQNPAFLILYVQHGIQVILEQDKNPTLKDKWVKLNFENRCRWKNSIQALFNFVQLKRQDYHPTISIQIPVDDLRAIYRALADKPLIVINL